jgi:hypothetical protein
MKNNNKIFLILFFSFFVALSAQAITTDDIDYRGNDSYYGGIRSYNFVNFFPDYGYISGVKLCLGNSQTVNVKLCKGILDSANVINNHNCANGILMASTTCTTTKSTACNTWSATNCSLGNTFSTNRGDQYYFELSSGSFQFQVGDNLSYATFPTTCGIDSDLSDETCWPIANHERIG